MSLHSSAISTLTRRFLIQSIVMKPTAFINQQKMCFSVLEASASCHGNGIAMKARRFSYDGETHSTSFFDVRTIAAAISEQNLSPYHPYDGLIPQLRDKGISLHLFAHFPSLHHHFKQTQMSRRTNLQVLAQLRVSFIRHPTRRRRIASLPASRTNKWQCR
jgi:hypothetical protein